MKLKVMWPFLAVAFVMFACSKAPSIEKVWILDKFELNDEAYNKIPEEQREMAKAQIKEMAALVEGKMSYDIQKEGKIEISVPNPYNNNEPEVNKGTWKLEEDGKKLTYSTEQSADWMNVVELTAEKLILEKEGAKFSFKAK